MRAKNSAAFFSSLSFVRVTVACMYVVSLVHACTAYHLSLRTNAASPSCWLSVMLVARSRSTLLLFLLESCELRAWIKRLFGA
ncbi:hypothetical protein GGI43DRAFT_414588 [Trichoderma evansii]